MKALVLTSIACLLGLFVSAQTVHTTYHDNGKVANTFYSSGDFTERVSYFDNGEVKQVATFRDNKPDGEWKTFNEKGELIKQGNYANGDKVGVWMVWSETAQQMYQFTYENNVRVSAHTWADKP